MSAYVLARENFVKIGRFLKAVDAMPMRRHSKGLHVYHPDMIDLKGERGGRLSPTEAANILLKGNLASVAYRYKEPEEEVAPIMDRDLMAPVAPEALDLAGIIRSLEYQSCERDDYIDSLAKATLNSLLRCVLDVAAEQAGKPQWA